MKMVSSILIVLALALPAGAQRVAAQDKGGDPAYNKIKNKIENMRLTVDFDKVSLADALNYIREFSALNIVIDAGVMQEYSEDDLLITMKVKDLLLKSILKLMLHGKGLTAMYKEGVLLVVTKDTIHQKTTLQLYDVRDLLFRIQDFPGPKVELTTPGAGGSPLTGATFSLDEEPKSTITEDFLVDIIQENTGDGSWDENANASISLANGLLIVTQTGRVHKEVKRLINLLRQYK